MQGKLKGLVCRTVAMPESAERGQAAVRRCLTVLVACLAVLAGPGLKAAPDDPVDIGDAALRHCVERELDKGAGEAVTESEMATLTQFSCDLAYSSETESTDTARSPYGKVRSAAGLEHATNLESLSLTYNAIRDLTPLAGLTSLTTLDLNENAIADISVLAGLSSLQGLYLGNNALQDVSALAGLTALTVLWLEMNAVSDISPLARLTSLQRLNLQDNGVADISALAGLASLEWLILYDNFIEDVSALAGLGALTSLGLTNNRISDIAPLVLNAGLGAGDAVSLWGNPLDAAAHVTHIPTLQSRGVEVWFDEPSVFPTNLRAIVGDGWLIFEWDPVVSATGYRYRLRAGTADWGPWTAAADGATSHTAENLANGTAYWFQVRAVHDGEAGAPSVAISATPTTEPPEAGVLVVTLGDRALRHCVERELDKRAGEAITSSEMATLSEFHCDLAFKSGIGSYTEVDTVRSPYGKVGSLAGLEHATNLESLSLGYNAITNLAPLAGLKSLTTLTLYANNSIADISVLAGLPSLQVLHLSDNAVHDVSALAGLTALTELRLDGNAVSDVSPLADLTSLQSLNLHGNAVADISALAGLASLQHLILYDNAVQDVSALAGLPLVQLGLMDNEVSDVSPLGGLTSLQHLSLDYNAVVDISGLAGLASLQLLGLSSNAVEDVSALAGLGALSSLRLEYNRISDIAPLVRNAALGVGDEVSLTGNPIACGSASPHVQALRGRGVEVWADAPPAPLAFAATPSDTGADLYWQAPAGCQLVRYQVRYGIGQSPDFGPWREIEGPWREVVDTGRMHHAVGGLTNGLLYTFEIRAVAADGAGAAARVRTQLAESPETPVAIEDAQLSAGIARALGEAAGGPAGAGRATGASDDARTITQGEMAMLAALDLRAMGIENLAGLGYAVNLKSLRLGGNRVASLAPIAGLEFLATLDLGGNGLSDISALADMPALERLWLNDNAIADIAPLAANAALGEGAVRPHGSSDYVDLRGNPLNWDAVFEHAPALRDRGAAVLVDDGAHRIPIFAPAGDPWRQSFARIVNPSAESGRIDVTAIDALGRHHGPTTLAIGPGQAVHFNSNDLENGNAEKGLARGVGAGTGDWRLLLRSSLPLDVFSYMRQADGALTGMTALAPEEYAQHRIPFFNPGSNRSQASSLRVINPGMKMARLLVEGVDQQGNVASVALTVPARGIRDFPASVLEEGAGPGIAAGGLGDGAGKWRLTATSYDGVRVLNLMDSPLGTRANLSAGYGGGRSGVHHLPLLPASASLAGGTGFARVVNLSTRSGSVAISAIDDEGRSQAAGTLTLAPHGVAQFNRTELEEGNAAKGLAGLAEGRGAWRLELRTDLDIAVYGYARTPDGFLAGIHELAPVTATGAHELIFFNPARNRDRASRLRVINLGAAAADVRIRAVDDAGNPAAAVARLTIPGGGARELTAQDLETGGAAGVDGAFGRGVGKWRLTVESDGELAVMSLLEDAYGHLTNLSR